MKQKDITFIKEQLDNNFLLNDYLSIVKTKQNQCVKIMYNDKVITISECGFAYLVSWWCDGCITSGCAQELSKLCSNYNDRF
jgi:hypothetical protein